MDNLYRWMRRNPHGAFIAVGAVFAFLGLVGGALAIALDDTLWGLVAGFGLGLGASITTVSLAEAMWTFYRRKEFYMDMAACQGRSLSEDEAWELAESRSG